MCGSTGAGLFSVGIACIVAMLAGILTAYTIRIAILSSVLFLLFNVTKTVIALVVIIVR